MAKDNYPRDPGYKISLPNQVDTDDIEKSADFGEFPYPEHRTRITYYKYYEKLFIGDHFGAFSYYVEDERFNSQYQRLRYVMANFAGLISKVMADFLFSEPVTITVPDGDQEFIDALIRANNLDTQFYESALSNSYFGDDLFKIRVGKRNPYDKDRTLIIEQITPQIYFPKVDNFNVRANPSQYELAWTFKLNDKRYLRKEIHEAGAIYNEVWELKGQKIVAKVPNTILGMDLPEMVPTGIDRPLITHVPNWKTGNRYFGISDYHDLDSLFFAINNRLTKVDNILDKHSDPILMVPQGILDEKGRVKKKALGVIEVQEGESGKPEYIVWDASLENAFKEIEKLVDMLFLTSETAPDVFGMGKGQADSGRALKYKLLRTIAKSARKKLYYDTRIKELLYTAQLMAKEHNLQVDGVRLQGEPAEVEISWNDGIPEDELDQVEIIGRKIDIGIQSKKSAIMELEQMDEASAEEKIKEIEDEKPKVEVPVMNLGNQDDDGSNDDDE